MIFRVTKFLAGNGLPFRGDKEELGEISGAGLFLNSVQQFAFEFQPELQRISKNLPRNAKYLAPDIQNEVIEVLANMVRKKHATAVKKAELFTIMVDGTTDKNDEEFQGVVARFFNLEGEKIEERTLNIFL